MSTQISEILEMSVAERTQLVEDIWDSIAAVPEALTLTDAEREELDRRLAAHAQSPDAGVPWDYLKKKIGSLSSEGR